MSRPTSLTVLLAALTALPALAIDMSLPGLPLTAVSLGADAAAVQHTISVFLIGFAVAQPACGPLADRFGRRPVLCGALALFAVGGLCCAVAPTLPALLACRFVQGAGACAGPVLARAIIRDVSSGQAAAARLAQTTAIMALAPVAAPTLGTLVLAVSDWRMVFAVLGVGGAALLLAVAVALPETAPSLDRHALAPRVLARNAASFVRHRQAFGNALATAFLFGGMFAYVAASPFALVGAFGMGPAAYSGLFAATALGIMAGSTAAPRILRAIGGAWAVLGGLAAATAAGLCVALLAVAGQLGVASLVGLVAVYTFARGLVVPVATAAALEPMRHMAGFASGLLGGLQMAAAALAASVASMVRDPLLGIGGTLTLFGAAALASSLWSQGLPRRAAVRQPGSRRAMSSAGE